MRGMGKLMWFFFWENFKTARQHQLRIYAGTNKLKMLFRIFKVSNVVLFQVRDSFDNIWFLLSITVEA